MRVLKSELLERGTEEALRPFSMIIEEIAKNILCTQNLQCEFFNYIKENRTFWKNKTEVLRVHDKKKLFTWIN